MQQPAQEEIATAMAFARRAVDENGVTETTLRSILQELRELARSLDLDRQIDLHGLHNSGAAATVLASEGSDGITLVLARFAPEAPTPVHDHGTWGVACVVSGRDRYTHWERLDDGRDPERAQVRVQFERILGPGDGVYWLDPPSDIHSQQGQGEAAWELVLFGRDALQTPRHYFDPETDSVRTASPQ